MKTPQISVIIPAYNRCELLRRAVSSVLEQSLPDFELLLIDDGSTDQTPSLQGCDPRLRYFYQKNQGVSSARNLGIRQSLAPWIAFLDSDDYWHKDKLREQMLFHRAHPEVRISQTEEIWIRHGKRVNAMKKHAKEEGDLFQKSLEACAISPSSVILRREIFTDLGHFDEAFPVCEDYELWLRVTAKYPVGLIPKLLITKTGGHADQLSRSLPAFDWYRIQAIDKLLKSSSLLPPQRELCLAELKKKADIYISGCLKREKTAAAEEAAVILKPYFS